MQRSQRRDVSGSPAEIDRRRTDRLSADAFCISLSSKARQPPCETDENFFVCSFYLFFLCCFRFFLFPLLDKGRILSNRLTLSGAPLSCSHHESFPAKFRSVSVFFKHSCLPAFRDGISRLFMLPTDPLGYVLFVCGHWRCDLVFFFF